MTLAQAIRFAIDQVTRFVSPPAVSAEWVLVFIGAVIIAVAPLRAPGLLDSIRRGFRNFASRKKTAVFISGLLPVIIRLCMLGFAPVPEPSIHDEFSQLLLGDTLAHGRLTNPTHPMWRHFESIHVIQKPTYNSMYPPGQGAFLALGEVLFHEPWAGVVISNGLMFAALCWMLQAWLPAEWALYGTLLAILKFGVVTLWINSYIGGAVPALAGALLFGAIPRLRDGAGYVVNAVWFALALVLLINTRPFEGSVLGCISALYLVPTLLRNPRLAARKILLPAGAVLACGGVCTAIYCAKVTGSPLRMPYQVNRDTYGWPENLAFLPVRKVSFRHQVLKDMYTIETRRREIYHSGRLFIDDLFLRLFENWTFFIGPVLTPPLLLLPWMLHDGRVRLLVFFVGVIAVLNLFQLVLYPYHLAPVVPVIFALVAYGIRRMYSTISSISKLRAAHAAIIIPALLVLVGAMKLEASALGLPQAYWERAAEPHGEQRAYIEHWLSARPRKQLVIVRYSPGHSPNQEWVYNHADIDGSKIVWARDMGEKSNAPLLGYFHDREVWSLDADVWPQQLTPYSRRTALPPTDRNMACPEECQDEPGPDPNGCGRPDK